MKFLFLAFALVFSDVAFAMSEHSPVTAARADMLGGIKTALDRFEIDCGRYPTTSEGFAALVNCPTNFSGRKWAGPYLDRIPTDPWGNDYAYRCPSIHHTNGYDLYSCGYDGISKSGGDDLDDINNWDPHSPHGFGLVRREGFFRTFFNSSATFIFAAILIPIPFFFAARTIASIFSQRVRDSIVRHPVEYVIGILLSLAILFLLLTSLPRIVG